MTAVAQLVLRRVGMSNVRYALRVLVKNPGFLVTAVLTLAMGIGANTAIFSAINTALLQPLPFPEADRLVFVREQFNPGRNRATVTAPDFVDWRRDQSPFEAMAGSGSLFVTLVEGQTVERWAARRVSADYFRVLRTPPALGRDFTAADEVHGAARTVILSDGLWRARFNADPEVIGRALTINSERYTVIGISSPRAEAWRDPDLFYVPLALTPNEMTETGNRWMSVSARLKPGVTIAQAEAQLAPLGEATQRARPWSNTNVSIAVQPMQDTLVSGLRQPLWLLLAVVATVLLIACANVANLVLIRSVSRQREVAIRTALGASRWQIVRQLLIENLTLAAIGGVAGLLLASWLQSLLPMLLPDSVLRFAPVSIDWRVLAFTATLVMGIGVFSGIAPALLVSRRPAQQTLQDASRGSGGPQRHRLGASLVVAEIALALMLLVGAGLFVRSFVRLLSVDPGLKPEGLAVMTLSLPEVAYGETEQTVQFYDRVLDAAQHTPGVKVAAGATQVPLRDRGFGMVAYIAGRPKPSSGDDYPGYFYRAVSPGYFAALGVPLVKGRVIESTDRAGRPRVGVINQAAARRYFKNEDPVGMRLEPDDGGDPPVEIVGVVGDVRAYGLDQEPQPELFVPYAQAPAFIWRSQNRTLNLLIRTTTTDATSVIPSIRELVRGFDGNVPTYRAASMTQVMEESTATPQRYMVVVSAFGSIALALAAVGIYGVMTFLVRQRTQEIGVRIALGAGRREVLQLVFGRVLRLTTIGLIIGIALALTLARWLGTFLFEIKPTDAVTYLAGGVVLFAVALLAAYLPASRATRIDPVTALRVE